MIERPDGYLAQVFVPMGHARYEKLVEWARTAQRKWWMFGLSSDGRSGIWIPYGLWERDRSFDGKEVGIPGENPKSPVTEMAG